MRTLGWAIDSPPLGALWATYTHTANMSINRQFTSNYYDPTLCHIRPLPLYSPFLFLYLCVCLSSTPVNHSPIPLSTFCDFDVPPLCEA
nr:hypothetical transcript [Hymenolepis microstoma]